MSHFSRVHADGGTCGKTLGVIIFMDKFLASGSNLECVAFLVRDVGGSNWARVPDESSRKIIPAVSRGIGERCLSSPTAPSLFLFQPGPTPTSAIRSPPCSPCLPPPPGRPPTAIDVFYFFFIMPRNADTLRFHCLTLPTDLAPNTQVGMLSHSTAIQQT